MTTGSTATEAATASAGVAITVAGSILGMDYDAILAGFVGALVAQTLVRDQVPVEWSAWRRYVQGFVQLVAAGLLAGLLSPVAESILAGMLPSRVPVQALHIATAAIIGMIAPVVVPILRGMVQKLAERT